MVFAAFMGGAFGVGMFWRFCGIERIDGVNLQNGSTRKSLCSASFLGVPIIAEYAIIQILGSRALSTMLVSFQFTSVLCLMSAREAIVGSIALDVGHDDLPHH